MCSFQTLVGHLFNNTIMDTDTFKLIRKFCVELQLSPDIEFTCYEAYMQYCKRYFCHLEKQLQQTSIEYNGAIKPTTQLIDQTLDEVEKTSLLHTLALISLCAKYVNGYRSEKLFDKFSKYIQINRMLPGIRETLISEFRNTEYIVFKYLEFNIKTSELYSVTGELASKITRRNSELIHFEVLHGGCVSLLRFIYLYRNKFDEILHYVEQNTYGYFGNEMYKLAAATLYASTMLNNSHRANDILNEIVHLTYLNESLLRKLGQSMYEFYLECMRLL